jgi:TP901 family phage tail tape measure protein
MTKGTVAAKGLGTSLKGVGASAQLATGGIRAMTMALISSGVGAFVVLIGAVIAGFSGLVNNSREFSKSLSNLGAISGASGDDLKALSDNAKRLGSTTAFTASEVLGLSTELAKLGFDSPQIVASSKGILDLAAAIGADLSEAATVAAGTMRGFEMEVGQSGRVADIMANSFSRSSLDLDKFRESMKLVSPTANLLEISLEDSTAALSVLADAQISGSMAGTQLKRVMDDLAQKTGKDFRTSLDITADKLSKATSNAEKLAIAEEMVGFRAKGTLITLVNNREKLDELSIAYLETGVAAAKAAKMLDNLDGDITKLGSAWNGLMLSMEDGSGIISRVARFFTQTLSEGIESFNKNLRSASAIWISFLNGLNQIGDNAKLASYAFGIFLDNVQLKLLDLKASMADVPIIGKAIAQSQLDADRKKIETHLKGLETLADETRAVKAEKDKIANEEINEALFGHLKRAKAEEAKLLAKTNKELGEATSEATKKRLKEEKDIREDFLKKFNKMERDAQDKSSFDKIRNKKEQHLKELKAMEMEAGAFAI